jgi:hypothetical protein
MTSISIRQTPHIVDFMSRLETSQIGSPKIWKIPHIPEFTFAEISEVIRQVEEQMEIAHQNEHHCSFFYLVEVAAELLERMNHKIPQKYFDSSDIEEGEIANGYPLNFDFKGLEYETFLEISDKMNAAKMPKGTFAKVANSILDNQWEIGMLTTATNKKEALIKVLYELPFSSAAILSACNYIQQYHPQERSLEFVNYILVWVKRKMENLDKS